MSEIYIDNIEKATLENKDWRRVIFTGNQSQLVLMSIPVGEEIDMEIHPDTDQFFRFEQGQGEITVLDKNSIPIVHRVEDGSGVVIPSGVYHRVSNIGKIPLKLYSIYSPPHHPDKLIQPTKNFNIIKRFVMLL